MNAVYFSNYVMDLCLPIKHGLPKFGRKPRSSKSVLQVLQTSGFFSYFTISILVTLTFSEELLSELKVSFSLNTIC